MNDQPNIKMNDDHKHIQLPSGAIANVSPDASPELLGALDTMAELAIKGAKAGSIRSAGSGTLTIKPGRGIKGQENVSARTNQVRDWLPKKLTKNNNYGNTRNQ